MEDNRLKKFDMQNLDIPALPAVASRALQILQRDDATVNDIEDVLMTDQGFSIAAYHHADVLAAFGDRVCEKLCRVAKIGDAMALHLGIGLQRNLELSDIDCRQMGMDNGKVRELIASFQKVYDEQKESLRV